LVNFGVNRRQNDGHRTSKRLFSPRPLAIGRSLAISGTSMQSFSGSTANGTSCGGRSIKTAQLKSYEAAKLEILPSVEHRQHRYLNNRADIACLPPSIVKK
jgi:hypothetical protein